MGAVRDEPGPAEGPLATEAAPANGNQAGRSGRGRKPIQEALVEARPVEEREQSSGDGLPSKSSKSVVRKQNSKDFAAALR